MNKEVRYSGLALSEGYAVARVCMFNENRHSNLPKYKVDGTGTEKELARAEQATAIAAEGLENLRGQVEKQIGKAEAEIFVAQKMILEDPTLKEKIFALITEDELNAEAAVDRVLNEYEERILSLDNKYIRERASDFGEIRRRLLDALGNMRPALQCDEAHCQKGRDRIVVAEELTPSLTVEIDAAHTVGFLTEHGGVNSHAAILARALGIPAISGLQGLRDHVGCGAEVLINGYTGEVVVWPAKETVAQVQVEQPRPESRPVPIPPVENFKVMANVNMFSDIREARDMMAEGIGLYRTEFEIMVAGKFFTEEELFERYSAVVKAIGGDSIVFRLLDIGSDKRMPFMNLPEEENPALGWRGTRLLLARKDLLRTQARALAMCSMGHTIKVMHPMIVDLAQFQKIKQAFQEATHDIPQGTIEHGIMFEVPSACLQARALYDEVDFASIGTNDLTQYLFAVDRDNDRVSYDYEPDRDVFWDLIASIASAARDAGKPLSICGELAGDPRYTRKLLSIGVDTVSVTPRRIPGVRATAADIMKQ